MSLRRRAGAIADPDLAQSYRQDLLQRFEALWTLEHPVRTFDAAARAFRGGRDGRRGTKAPLRNDASRAVSDAAQRMTQAPQTWPSALALGALRHPQLIDERFEALNVQGFCDPALAAVARDMISVRIVSEDLDADGLRRHLAARGHDDRLEAARWAAERANAAFLREDASFEEVRALWSQVFEAVLRVTALERALADAKSDLEQDPDFPTLMRIKAERDAMRRAIGEGTFPVPDSSWNGRGTVH